MAGLRGVLTAPTAAAPSTAVAGMGGVQLADHHVHDVVEILRLGDMIEQRLIDRPHLVPIHAVHGGVVEAELHHSPALVEDLQPPAPPRPPGGGPPASSICVADWIRRVVRSPSNVNDQIDCTCRPPSTPLVTKVTERLSGAIATSRMASPLRVSCRARRSM